MILYFILQIKKIFTGVIFPIFQSMFSQCIICFIVRLHNFVQNLQVRFLQINIHIYISTQHLLQYTWLSQIKPNGTFYTYIYIYIFKTFSRIPLTSILHPINKMNTLLALIAYLPLTVGFHLWHISRIFLILTTFANSVIVYVIPMLNA